MSTEAYLATETTKAIGQSLERLDEITSSLRSVNTERLVDIQPDLLTKLHESITRMKQSLEMSVLTAMILSAVCSRGGDDEEPES